MKEQVLQTIAEYSMLKPKDSIIVGVSGGPDSITLLDLLVSLRQEWELQLYVCHINHGIRQEAKHDEEYVKAYCQKNGISCYVKHIQVAEIAKQKKISTETAGREERYAFFEEIAEKVGANHIATAHTANDNAETILMNLLRGTGISGLKGIEPIRDGRYIRPLITCTRKQIEAYCAEKNLQPCIDQTNFENIYTRNKIRNELLPMLEQEFNPNIITGLNRLGDLVQEEEACWEKQLAQIYAELVQEETKEKIALDWKAFQKLEPLVQSKMLRYTVQKLCGTTRKTRKSTYPRYS